MASIAVDIEIPRGETVETQVTYELPLAGEYELYVRPQPLVRDAQLSVEIDAPSGWRARGPGAGDDGDIEFEGPFTQTFRFSTAPSRRPGLTGAWDSLVRFWNEPLFD